MEVPNLTRGIAVLIIYTDFEFPKKSERKSALDDYENMREMFQHLNFDVRHIFNEPAAELLKKLKGIRDDIKESDECFVCMISSHGEEVPRSDSSHREHILYTNSGSVKTEDIVRMFNNKNCKCLNGKPRLFIIQVNLCWAIRKLKLKFSLHNLYIIFPHFKIINFNLFDVINTRKKGFFYLVSSPS
ncbi:hypothetical protein FSP39_023421 [Pinctada imbricata]|uniref:Caspase family p20 domain-containing protein n=1 Tax=Pinctada imbricata TaxID=66713 RepID=A0AA88YEZ3_PINIB|nr:hypothetical protein FSP39_023421 [Pinctada imbricata]